MGYVVGKLIEQQASGTSFVPNFSNIIWDTRLATANQAILAGDLILTGLANRQTADSSFGTPAGYTKIGTYGRQSSQAHIWFWLKAAGGETGPTYTTVFNAECIGITLIVRGVDATTQITASSARKDWTNVGSFASDTPTAAAGDLVIHSCSANNTGCFPRTKINEATGIARYDGSNVALAVAYKQVESAGVITAVNWYQRVATNGGNAWVICIKTASGAPYQPDVRTNINELNWYGLHGSVNTLVPATNAWTKPSTFNGSGTLNGINLSTAAVGTVTTSTQPFGTAVGTFSGIPNAENLAVWAGAWHTVPSTSMTGMLFSINWALDFNSSVQAATGSDGVIVCFSDGTEWVAYQVAKKSKGWGSSVPQTAIIALGAGEAYRTSAQEGGAAINWGAITRIGYFWHRIAVNTNTLSILVRNALLISTQNSTSPAYGAQLTGGGSTFTANPSDYYTALTSWELQALSSRQGEGQVLTNIDMVFGDGTNKTYVDTSAVPVSFPQAWSATDTGNWQMGWNVPTGKVYYGVKTTSTDTINLIADAFVAPNKQLMVIDSGANTGAAVSIAGSSIVGMTFTDNAGFALSSGTFQNGGTVTLKANATSLSVSKTVGAVPAVAMTANSKTLSACTTDVTGTSATYHLETSTAVDAITLTNHTFTGDATSVVATIPQKVHVLKTTGTVTITINGTTSLAANEVTSEGATVSVVSDPVNQKVTVTGITTGARVQIYDTTSSTELFNGTSTAGDTVVTGSTVAWTDPAAASANRAIRVRVSYVSGVTAKNFIETSGLTCGQTGATAEITYPVSPTDDTVYNANGENGATIYGGGEIAFVDASPDRIEMAMTANTLSLKEQYAAWAYYVFTSAGIATDIDYINAIDTANYEFTGIRWKNVSSPTAPLEITGGYAWDSVTLSPMTLIDTSGGTLFLAPAHVVAYQTTGTYAITGDLQDALDAIAGVPADVLSAAQTTPIHSDVRKVVGITVDGTGTDGDPWGPV